MKVSILVSVLLLVLSGSRGLPSADLISITANPQPASGDFSLPMPCDSAMVFRKVMTPTQGLFGDRRITLGSSDPRFQIMESPRFAHIAGSYLDPSEENARFFYIGKYEVSERQYHSIQSSRCDLDEASSSLPINRVSWFDAMSFTHAYNSWLIEHVPANIPRDHGVIANIRLPTEAEWEFAARGGIAVTPSEFAARVPPGENPISRYAWHQGPRSAAGRLQPIGLLLPNPLGLYDTLGNVDEIVLDVFHLTAVNRAHGQAGGYVIKGGNMLTDENSLRTAYRQEVAHFDEKGPKRLRTVGFRIAIAAPVITSISQIRRYSDERKQLAIANEEKASEDGVTRCNRFECHDLSSCVNALCRLSSGI